MTGADIGSGSRRFISIPLIQIKHQRHCLPGVYGGAEYRAVALVREVLSGVEGLVVYAALISANHAIHKDAEGSGSLPGNLCAVAHPAEERIGKAEAVSASGKLEIKVDFFRTISETIRDSGSSGIF